MLEIQNHNTKKQIELNKRILELSKKYGIEMIAGLDSHYIDEGQAIEREYVLEAKGVSYEEVVEVTNRNGKSLFFKSR